MLLQKKIASVTKLPGKRVLMVTLIDDEDHGEISELVQDPRTGGDKIFIDGKCFQVTIPLLKRPTSKTIYELYVGGFSKRVKIHPFQMLLFKLSVRVKYISCPVNKTTGGRCNFIFVGVSSASDVERIIFAKKKNSFRSAGKPLIVAESQSMIDKNGGRKFQGKGLDEK